MAQTLANPERAPAPRRWTRQEYLRLAEAGYLGDEPRTELIDGQILQTMPQGNAHVLAVSLVFYALQAAFGGGYHLRSQSSLPLGEEAMPEPDVVVLRGSPRDYDGREPDPREDIVLVVEVSDSTLAFDRTIKTALYARHGVPEYWIVDLPHHTLEVRRRPLDEGYAETLILREDESVAIGGGTVAVFDVLPKPAA